MNYRRLLPLAAAAALLARPAGAQPDPQPFLADVRRVEQALDFLGSPLSPADTAALDAALSDPNPAGGAAKAAAILDRYCLFDVTISPEERVGVSRGLAPAVLAQAGWRQFLVKVDNRAGATGRLVATSPNGRSVFAGVQRTRAATDSDRAYAAAGSPAPTPVYDRWLDLQMFDSAPLAPELSGLDVEYRIVQLYSRDAGKREASVAFDVGQGSQEIGFGNGADVLFRCEPARSVRLRLRDEQGRPTTVSLEIRDRAGRVCPSQAKRLAPDFAFQPQIYRQDGDVLQLTDGDYTVKFRRGPESIPETFPLRVDAGHTEWSYQVRRWIDAAALGWWSGDHHIHAAGCAHYCEPTQGVLPSDMGIQCLGEDLKVGGVLTYGPCFDYQKQFFSPVRDAFSKPPYLLHYDIEVSGFGSQRSGHLCLLGLRDQLYPGCSSDENWPTYCLKILAWAKRQGAVTGTAHSGWGLQPAQPGDTTIPVSTSSADIRVQTDALPNWIVPPYNGIGANEYVVDVTQQVPGPDGRPVPAVDFYSAGNTPAAWELNMWYHTLNCGFRPRLAGETDFPCIYMERVGMGRSYVKLGREPSYRDWIEGLRAGRSYVGDGKSHLMDFEVGGVSVGEKDSELDLSKPGTVRVTARVAAWLPVEPDKDIQGRSDQAEPYWDLERARIGSGRTVPVEVVVNGEPVAQRIIAADGVLRPLSFDVPITRSSWVALRILYSSHTNPVFVLVDGKPIRASRASAEWCLQGVDRCWSQKERFIATAERAEARAAYDRARAVYRRIAAESEKTPDVATYTYKQAGPLAIQADVYRPQGFAGRRPVVVWIHGGALMLMDRKATIHAAVRDALLAHGVVVVSIDYRLAPESPLSDILSDVQDAFRWVREKGPALFDADPTRIAVAGGSAGGYLTLAAGYLVDPRPRALVSFWGYGDLIGPWLSQPSHAARHFKVTQSREQAAHSVEGPPISNQDERPGQGGRDFYLYTRQDGTWPKVVSGGWDPRTEPEKFFPYIPIRHVTADYPPTLLIHGLKDTEVPVENSIRMYEELRRQGVECRLMTDPDADHSSNWSAAAQARTDRAAAEFLLSHLQ